MRTHPLGTANSLEQRRTYAKRTAWAALLLFLVLAMPPLLPVALVAGLVAWRRQRKARRRELSRTLPQLERAAMYERAAWLQQITSDPL